MTRARILSEARAVFGRSGYAEASLREIASAVGMKPPSLYAHFASKHALYESVYAEVSVEHAAFFDELARASSDLPPLERLGHLLRGIETYYRSRPDLAEFSLRASIDEYRVSGTGLREIFLASESGLADAVRGAHEEGVATGDFAPGEPEGFIALFLVVMDGLFLQLAHYEPDLYRERFELAWACLCTLLSPEDSALSQRMTS